MFIKKVYFSLSPASRWWIYNSGWKRGNHKWKGRKCGVQDLGSSNSFSLPLSPSLFFSSPLSPSLSLSLSLSPLSRHEVHEGCLSVRPFRPFRPSLRLHARPYVIPLFCHRASLHRLFSLSLLPFHWIDPVRTHRPLAHSKLLGFGTIWCSNWQWGGIVVFNPEYEILFTTARSLLFWK